MPSIRVGMAVDLTVGSVMALPEPNLSVDVRIRAVGMQGSKVRYTTGGEGPTVLFLHGWGLGHHAYRPGIRRLAQLGFRVFAPALPGFGGTPDLAEEDRSFAGYARWARRFVDAAGVANSGPIHVVGHSFGGGVSIQFALDNAEVVHSGMVLNAVGGSWREGSDPKPMANRPLWHWGLHISSDVVSLMGSAVSAMPSVLEDLVPNVMRNPFGVARVSKLARTADLTDQVKELHRRGFPVNVVHSDDDGVIPMSSHSSLCAAAEIAGTVVDGNHSWPLTEPEVFARQIAGWVLSLR